jgi:drug/metabolite transporter (DMT)-like permease
MMSNEKLKGHGLILLANIFFAVNISVSKSLIPSHVSPEALTLLRSLFACAMFWLTSFLVKYEKVAWKDLGLLFICSLCGITLNQSLFMSGLNLTSPVDASIIATAGPIYVMLLAALVLKEPITKQKTFGVLIGLAGAVTLILTASHTDSESSSGMGGNLRIVISNMLYSIYVVLSRPLSQKYSAVTIMKWMFLFATILLLPIMYRSALEIPAFHREVWDWTELSAIFYVLMFATFIPYLMIPMALKRLRPTTVSMYNYIQPIIASLLAIMVGQDHFTLWKLFSAALVFIGVYLVTQSKSRADVEREQQQQSPH